MLKENGYEIALINTDGQWYALMTHLKEGWTYETLGYDKRDDAKNMARLLAYMGLEAEEA